MTVRSSTTVFGLLAFACLVAADDKAKKKEEATLDGTWKIVSAELGGDAVPEEVTKNITLVIAAEKYTVKTERGDDVGTVKIDNSKTPKEIDVIGVEGPNKGKTYLAIYELDGDTLNVCYELKGKDRPKAFKSEKDSSQFNVVYKRQKP